MKTSAQSLASIGVNLALLRPGTAQSVKQAMRRPAARIVIGAICLVMAGCSGPDLTVTAALAPNYTCNKGTLGINLRTEINNAGSDTITLLWDWGYPWLSAYPSISIPGFVSPVQTGSAYAKKQTVNGQTVTLLAPGQSIEVPLASQPDQQAVLKGTGHLIIPRAPGGSAYNLIVDVSPYRNYFETNLLNNTAVIPIPAKICG